jgi:gas vesicle protein
MANEEGKDTLWQSGSAELLLILGGVALGALLGILYAPRSGERTRRQLRRGYEDMRDRATDFGDDLLERAEELRQSVAERISAGQDYVGRKSEDVREGLAALEEGLGTLRRKLARR